MTLPELIDTIATRWLARRGYQVVSKSMWRWMHRARTNERRAWIEAAMNAQRERDAAMAQLRDRQS